MTIPAVRSGCLLTVMPWLAACSGGGATADLQAPAITALPAGGSFTQAPAVTLTASEDAEIHCSTDGQDPAPGAANTMSGRSPFGPLYLQAGTTQLRCLAVDASGNRSAVHAETYVVDLTDPVIAFPAGPPDAPPLLEATTVTWQCAEACDYVIELGGNGTAGSGTALATGSAAANAPQHHSVPGLQLAELGTSTLWVHATDRAGRHGVLSTPLQLRPFTFLPVGRDPQQLALLPDGQRLYVTNTGADTVSVLDTDPASATFHTAVATVAVGSRPYGLAVAPDGGRVYVTNNGATSLDLDSISAIDTATDTAFASIPLAGNAAPTGIAITADGSRAYFPSSEGRLYVLDVNPASASYHQIAGYLSRPLLLQGSVAIAPDGSRAVVDWSGLLARSIEIVDVDPLHATYHQTLASPIPLATGAALDLCITADSRYAFAGDTQRNLCRIDLQLGGIDRSSSIAAGALALLPGRPLLLNATAHALMLVSTTDLARIGNVTSPWEWVTDRGLAVTPDGTRAYALCRDTAGNHRVAVLQLLY